ncbi:unnamed protein product [Merluccius merluccius]
MTTRASQEQDESCARFCQYVEDNSLGAYDGLVIQNASDIAREHDRVRNENNWAYLQEKHQEKRWHDEAVKRIGDDVTMATETSYSGKHFRMGFMTMPASQDRLPAPCSQGFTVRSQSLHSVGGGDDDTNTRKHPPPKPKRDPNTKLSISSEAVNGGPGNNKTPNDSLELQEVRGKFQPYNDECKKMPPPKPKRNPNTQLSTSFDESYIFCNHGNKKSPLLKDKCSSQSQSPPPASRDTDEEEPVYIEMVGNIKGQEALDDDQSECVYEEMKYPMLDEFMQDSKWDNSCQMVVLEPDFSFPPQGSLSDIPPPFPNLLSHRPPLLVFPPAPAQCSPNSDESPLTPLDVTRLPMLEHVGVPAETPQKSSHHRKSKDRERDTITPSGRSSAPPLASNLYNSAGSSHSGQGYPRSHSACPSPVSMGRCLTPLTLKRPPPYDSLMAGGSMPRSHKSQDGASKLNSSSSANGSLQNVSTRCQTPTSPLEELSSLLNSGRHMINKGSGGRKGREGDGDARSQTRPDSKDRERTGIISSQEWDLQSKSPSSSSHASSRMGRSSVSPTMLLGGGRLESRTGCKLGRSASTSGVPSSAGAPQRSAPHPALSQMPWICGDATMMEMIEKKRVLCGEIKCRQGAERSLYKQDSMPILPSWKRKQPPPYPYPATNTAVFWDTAI